MMWILPMKDRLHAWFIAFGLFIVNCIDDGILKAFGVLLSVLPLQYNVEEWIFGTNVSIMCFLGSIIRPGLRCSGVYIFSVLHDYFDDHYALASGLLLAGRPVGTMAFAPLTQFLMFRYGGRGTVLVLGAITFHITLIGALLKPKRSVYAYVADREYSKDTGRSRHRKGHLQHFLNIFEADLFQKPAFLSILASGFALIFGFQAWMLYLIPHAIAKGLTPYHGTALATAGCIGQLLGMVTAGVILDMCAEEKKIRVTAFLCTGVSFAVDPWFTTFSSLLLLSFLFGFGLALANTGLIQASRYVKDDGNITAILSYLTSVAAISRLISGSASGWFYHKTGSYEVSFLIVAGLQFAAAIILCVEVVTSDKNNS